MGGGARRHAYSVISRDKGRQVYRTVCTHFPHYTLCLCPKRRVHFRLTTVICFSSAARQPHALKNTTASAACATMRIGRTNERVNMFSKRAMSRFSRLYIQSTTGVTDRVYIWSCPNKLASVAVIKPAPVIRRLGLRGTPSPHGVGREHARARCR